MITKILHPESNDEDPIITGMGTEWPSTIIGRDDLYSYVSKRYPQDAPWFQTMMKVNDLLKIESRSVVDLWNDPQWNRDGPPTAEELDAAFRHYGSELAVGASLKAMEESNITASSITHIIAVTATNIGCPGYDRLVSAKLGLSPSVERVLLSGVGCAGGLAALRVASGLASGATLRGQEAKILIVASEVCSIFIGAELHAAAMTNNVGIGPSLFGDGASALILCNSQSLDKSIPRRFAVVDWRTGLIPDTEDEMTLRPGSHGPLLSLSRKVPELVTGCVRKPFGSLIMSNNMQDFSPADFDWALHTGGLAIIKGVQQSMGLTDDVVRSTKEIYRTRGNISSASVLSVLENLRSMGEGRPDVVACSFGPGLTMEMLLLRRLL